MTPDNKEKSGESKSEPEDSSEKSEEKVGLGMAGTVTFIIAELAGGGILALAYSSAIAGFFGLVMIFLGAIITSITGTVLSRCWIMILRNNPEVHEHCAEPYPTIAYYAYGKYMRLFVKFSVYVTLYGIAVVLLIISAENIAHLFDKVGEKVSLCYMIVILGVILTPFGWLKTPKDFWQVAVMAAVTTVIAVLLIIIQTLMDITKGREALEAFDIKVKNNLADPINPSFGGIFIAFGIILYGYGGMCAFPTIQLDMKEPDRFPIAVVYSMIIILFLYLPIAAVGWAVYGEIVEQNMLESLSNGWLKTIANLSITIHCVAAIIIWQNPLSQAFEVYFKVKDHFTWKRAAIRSLITSFIIFTGVSCPKFGTLMALVGGSTVTLNTFIFPPLFYMKLCHDYKGKWPQAEIRPGEMPTLCVIVFVGLFGCVSATYQAALGMFDPNAFVPPCYFHGATIVPTVVHSNATSNPT